MSLFDSFSPRARRAIFWANSQAHKFFRKTKQQKESVAKQVLAKSWLSVDSMEAATEAGLITPQTLVLNDAIFKLNAQLTAIADLLISKGFLTRNEFVSLLDENPGPITREASLLPLINALCEKGQITKSEKDILGTEPRPYTAIEKDKT